jgi:GT2 family glycosyltransferase
VTFSVVIATRDRAAFLDRALESLRTQRNAPAFDVVVADNGSQDATADVVARQAQSAPFPLRRVYVPEPNRGAARNRGVALTGGDVVAFVDDDVVLPPDFLAAHARERSQPGWVTVTGPILNVPDYSERPKPGPQNGSRAFFCTCNASVDRAAFDAAGGFDEQFVLYGWEDTELGIRLRRLGVRRQFSWDAYLYHIKPAATETLDAALHKTTEKAKMAARLVRKDPTTRTRLATGAYAANVLRAALLTPGWSLRHYEALARNERAPAPLRAHARARYLDGVYVRELRVALRTDAG